MQKQISILLLFFFFTFNSFSQDTLQEIKVRGNSKSLKKSYSLTANTTTLTRIT